MNNERQAPPNWVGPAFGNMGAAGSRLQWLRRKGIMGRQSRPYEKKRREYP